jgi:hypothetical protein
MAWNELAFGSDTTNNTSNPGGTRVTASISPTNGARVFACLFLHGGVTDAGSSVVDPPTISGAGITWTLEDNVSDGTDDSNTDAIFIWSGISDATTGAITFTEQGDRSSAQASWVIAERTDSDGGIGNTATDYNSATTAINPGLTFQDANSAVMAFCGWEDNDLLDKDTPTNFTEMRSQNSGEGRCTQLVYREANTNPTWTLANAHENYAIAIEIKPAAAAGLGTPLLAESWHDDISIGVTITAATGASAHEMHYGATSGFSPTTGTRISSTLGAAPTGYIHASTVGSTADPRPRSQHYYKTRATSTSTGVGPNDSAVLAVKTAPKRPLNLQVTSVSQNTLATKWQDRTTGDPHRVYRRDTTTSAYSLIALTTAGTTSYTHQGLAAGTAYDLAVAAYDSTYGQSGFSSTVGQTGDPNRTIGGRHV